MADISDVSNSLVALIGTILYPNGPGTPPLLGSPAKIYAGWPIPTSLDADLAAAIPVTNVSVYPAPMNRNTTRYLDQWEQVSLQTATLGLVVAGQTVTVVGTAPVVGNPHNMVVFADGLPYVYQASFVDSLNSVARNLAALIPGAISNGPVITLPNTARIGAVRVGVTGVSSNVTRNQEQVFQIGVWAAAPDIRDLFAKTIDGALAAIRRFPLPDTSLCRLIWKTSLQSDKWQKQALYRRDLFYTCEYATLEVETQTQVTVIQENFSASVAGVDPAIFIATIFEGNEPGSIGTAPARLLTEQGNALVAEDMVSHLLI